MYIFFRLTYPSKLDKVIEADQHQKVLLKFVVRDTVSGKLTKVHQAFVKVTHLSSRREIIFVAEADSNNVYKFDLDVTTNSKDFGHINGKYKVEVIIGDAAIVNPTLWHLADISFTFPDGSNDTPAQDYTFKVIIFVCFFLILVMNLIYSKLY